jgi:hypothetical protein
MQKIPLLVFRIASIIPGGAWAQPPAGALVRQIDHIMVSSDQPEKLFQLFSEKIELPLGWPFKSYGTFSSGGVGFGNVILELMHLDGGHAGLAGVALEPNSLPELVAGKRYGGPTRCCTNLLCN